MVGNSGGPVLGPEETPVDGDLVGIWWGPAEFPS
jgi:hypothetical protein